MAKNSVKNSNDNTAAYGIGRSPFGKPAVRHHNCDSTSAHECADETSAPRQSRPQNSGLTGQHSGPSQPRSACPTSTTTLEIEIVRKDEGSPVEKTIRVQLSLPSSVATNIQSLNVRLQHSRPQATNWRMTPAPVGTTQAPRYSSSRCCHPSGPSSSPEIATSATVTNVHDYSKQQLPEVTPSSTIPVVKNNKRTMVHAFPSYNDRDKSHSSSPVPMLAPSSQLLLSSMPSSSQHQGGRGNKRARKQ